MKLSITKLWVRFLCPAWSVFPNLFVILTRLHRIRAAREDMKRNAALLQSAHYKYRGEYLQSLLRQFVWRCEQPLDWRPWVITIYLRSLRDDCDGAAILARWALGKMGEESRLVHLYPAAGWQGHVVCVCDRLRIVASNGAVHRIAQNVTDQSLLTLFPAYAGGIR